MLGFSMGPIMAGTWIWLEKITPITRLMSVIMTFMGMGGLGLSPLIVGQLISNFPIVFTIQTLTFSIVLLILIFLGTYIGKKIRNVAI